MFARYVPTSRHYQCVKLSKYIYSQITLPDTDTDTDTTSHKYRNVINGYFVNAISYNISSFIAVDKLPYT